MHQNNSTATVYAKTFLSSGNVLKPKTYIMYHQL